MVVTEHNPEQKSCSNIHLVRGFSRLTVIKKSKGRQTEPLQVLMPFVDLDFLSKLFCFVSSESKVWSMP